METKQQIRARFRKMRDDMPKYAADELSRRICGHILGWNRYQSAERILFYYPLGNEVSLLGVMQDALAAGRRVAFPKVLGESMEFYEISDLKQLQEGSFHVMEPFVQDGAQPVRWADGLCFVPGTAFDKSGGRLGYGKGYYDRYFADKSGIVLAGCAYECQITAHLPTETWDLKMDLLVSENGWILP